MRALPDTLGRQSIYHPAREIDGRPADDERPSSIRAPVTGGEIVRQMLDKCETHAPAGVLEVGTRGMGEFRQHYTFVKCVSMLQLVHVESIRILWVD